MVFVRAIPFSVMWLVFWYYSSKFVFNYVADVAGPYWAQGIKAFPVILLAFMAADHRLMRTSFGQQHPSLAYLGLCLLGIALYWPAMVAVVWLMILID
ncbi:hypothetical protein [Pseudomonas sp. BN515]|uniref:hypothetical protein n=1 Tax=Pseudomonas sp. BN515 TaxID=2567892 RepID=UPI00245656B1|nr:hypothetical protein [Pseudomonas sp. BN515]MDH4872754.1 hypothetical protein [Pseudomonas sp. BN515]